MFYDGDVRQALATAKESGLKGSALENRVKDLLEVDKIVDFRLIGYLADSFRKIVWPVTRAAIKPADQPRLFA